MDPVARDPPPVASILDLDPVAQHPVKRPVVGDQRRPIGPQDFAQRILAGLVRNVRVEPVDRLAQPPHQKHIAKRLPLHRRSLRRDVRPVCHGVSQVFKPGQGGVFDGRFVEVRHLLSYSNLSISRRGNKLRHTASLLIGRQAPKRVARISQPFPITKQRI